MNIILDMDKPNPKALESYGGVIRLPIGFRFQPTDEELLVHYLKRKNHSLPLPASVIPQLEQDVFHTNPWDLPGDLREKRYFFSRRRKENMNNKCSSSSSVPSGCGYWKAIGEDKQIVAALGSNQIFGINKRFIFYQGKRRTAWVMHLYSLVDYYYHHYSITHLLPSSKKYCTMAVGDWVVCRIYQKKRKTKRNGSKKHESIRKMMRSKVLDTNNIENQAHLEPPAQASSSYSSGITQINAVPDQSHQEVTSHYYNDNIFIHQL